MSLLLYQSFGTHAGTPVAPPPTVFGVYPFASPFALLVEKIDKAARSILGGDTITYKPKVGSAVVITGIFDTAFVLDSGDTPAGVESGVPAIFLRLNELPANPDLDDPTLTIRGLNYRVVERRSDGIGGIVLVLRLID